MSKQNELSQLADAVTVDGSNVGIGTSSPTSDLSVGSTTTSSGDIALRTTKTAAVITPSNSNAGGLDIDVGWVAGGQGPLTFSLGSTQRMAIDSSGRVTMPYQPAFMAHGNQGWQVVTTIPFGGVTFNTSNSYNSTTHRFTAPVAGKYMFISTIYQDNTYDCRFCMTINGSQLTSFGDVVPYGYTRGPTTSGETTLSIQYIANLNLNDFVEVKQRTGYGSARVYTAHSHFGGHLIG